MSNYISNILVIKGNRFFLDRIIGRKFCLANTVPIPDEIGTVDWFYENWGIAWDVHEDVQVDYLAKSTRITFYTPWNPPLKWLEKVGLLFPDCKFILYWAGEYPKCGKVKVQNEEYEGILWNEGPQAKTFYRRHFHYNST